MSSPGVLWTNKKREKGADLFQNTKGRLFKRGLTQTPVLHKQWALGIP